MRLLPALAALLAAAPSPALAAPPAPALLERVLEAYGGRKALERAVAVRQECSVTSTMRGGVAGRMLRVFQRPDSLRVEVSYPGEEPEIRVVHRGRGERNGVDVTGPPRDAMVLQAARLALPLALVREGARVVDRGEVERGGARLRALALQVADGVELVAEVDPATGRVVRSSGTIPGPMGAMEFATEYSRFERVSGVLFALHEENYVRGQRSGSTDLRKVEVLPRAPAGAFDERL